MAATSIFVNLPVTDLDRAKAYYEAIGFPVNPIFTDHNAACIVLEQDHSYLMLLTEAFFATQTDTPLVHPSTGVNVLIAVALDARGAVDEIVERGVAAGGAEGGEAQDLGFMYTRDLVDPDGNGIQFLWSDPAALGA